MCEKPKETTVEYGEEPDNTTERAEEIAETFEFADTQPTESHEVGDVDFEGENAHQEYATEEDAEYEGDDCDPDEDCDSDDEYGYDDEDCSEECACDYCTDPVPGCEPGVYCPYED